jgi:hypothetical protein
MMAVLVSSLVAALRDELDDRTNTHVQRRHLLPSNPVSPTKVLAGHS